MPVSAIFTLKNTANTCDSESGALQEEHTFRRGKKAKTQYQNHVLCSCIILSLFLQKMGKITNGHNVLRLGFSTAPSCYSSRTGCKEPTLPHSRWNQWCWELG